MADPLLFLTYTVDFSVLLLSRLRKQDTSCTFQET